MKRRTPTRGKPRRLSDREIKSRLELAAAFGRVKPRAYGFDTQAGFTKRAILTGALSKYQRFKLRKYDREIRRVLLPTFKEVRIPGRTQKERARNKKALQFIERARVNFRDIKVAFLNTATPKQMHVRWKRGVPIVTVRDKILTEQYFLADQKTMRKTGDVQAEADRLIALLPPGTYSIMTSNREAIGFLKPRELLSDLVKKFLVEYGADRLQAFFTGFHRVARTYLGAHAYSRKFSKAISKAQKAKIERKVRISKLSFSEKSWYNSVKATNPKKAAKYLAGKDH